jgi:hypothetical protein
MRAKSKASKAIMQEKKMKLCQISRWQHGLVVSALAGYPSLPEGLWRYFGREKRPNLDGVRLGRVGR